MPVPVRKIMSSNPVMLPASTSVLEAARLMRDNDIGDVIVQKDGKICGIVTDRDIVIRAIADRKDLDKTDLESICSKQMTTLTPDQTDQDAIRLMREKAIRRLPVLEGERIVGVVSLGDLAVERDPKSLLGRISAAQPNH
jgi:CBS domain-containing protein